MSQQTQNALPDPATAYDTLFNGVHARVFFNKCAAAGFSPRNEDEARQMLETAGKLRQVTEHAQVKQAAAQDNPYYQMNAGLDHLMAQYGLASPAAFADAEASYKQAAAQLMEDPAFYNSALSLKAQEAETMRAEFDAWRAAQGG